ncbi:SDR family NAD(P)-dependent oxidoreductase [Sinimarinibacterium thermocellulolyticum]|uniref:SDR family NAD(P)-dependent oxidoreductase n=1 Tax=Sinimarinibacterium thermocellulolyticum TaxID=3170016 RepID=A0ABV2A8E1_9GAMM
MGDGRRVKVVRTALITGANRGIGLHTARALARQGLRVIVAARARADLDAAVAQLASERLVVMPLLLDVARIESIRAAATVLAQQDVAVDVLVNNAGVYFEGSVLSASDADFVQALEVNTLGSLRCARAFLPGMIERGYGRIVNLSSGYGCFANGLDGPAAYSLSKAALNAATVILARACRGDVKIAAVDPGWVRTRMGGPQAPRTVEEAAADVAWAATLDASAPNGVLWRRRERAAW